MSVSGTPQSPKPPQSNVVLGFISLIASEADATTLLISFRRLEDAKVRARCRDYLMSAISTRHLALIVRTWGEVLLRLLAVRKNNVVDETMMPLLVAIASVKGECEIATDKRGEEERQSAHGQTKISILLRESRRRIRVTAVNRGMSERSSGLKPNDRTTRRLHHNEFRRQRSSLGVAMIVSSFMHTHCPACRREREQQEAGVGRHGRGSSHKNPRDVFRSVRIRCRRRVPDKHCSFSFS
jgi:hypothetical protein